METYIIRERETKKEIKKFTDGNEAMKELRRMAEEKKKQNADDWNFYELITKKEKELEFEKEIQEAYDKYHGKTDEEIAQMIKEEELKEYVKEARQKDLEKYFQLTEEERIEKYMAGIGWNDWSQEGGEEKMKLTPEEAKAIDKLMAMDKIKRLEDNIEYTITTANRKTGEEGEATLLRNGEKKIKVFEGNPDGSDDKVMSYKEFVNNYQFMLTFY